MAYATKPTAELSSIAPICSPCQRVGAFSVFLLHCSYRRWLYCSCCICTKVEWRSIVPKAAESGVWMKFLRNCMNWLYRGWLKSGRC